jgi:hypothetical protein
VAAHSSAASSSDRVVVTRTDATGRFQLNPAGRPPFTVRVEAHGLAAVTIDHAALTTPLVVALAAGGVIEGTAREASTGEPVAGAQVEARWRDSKLPLFWEPRAGVVATTTDAGGKFRLEGCAAGSHVVSAVARGKGRGENPGVRVGERVDLALVPGATLAGSVRDARGQALSDAVVRIQAEDSSALPRVMATDAAGRFEAIGLKPGRYSIIVRRENLAPTVVRDLVLRGEADAHADVVLVPGAAVTGRLVGPNRKAVAGLVQFDELEGEPSPYSLAALLAMETGLDGRFWLEHVPPGSHVLIASTKGLVPTHREAEVGAFSPTLDLGDVVFEAGATIRGRVRDMTGKPIPGARVFAPLPETPKGAEATTEKNGRFVLAIPEPGRYHLRVTAAGYGSAFRFATTGENVDLVLDVTGSLAGFVVDESGQPVKAYLVSADREIDPGEVTEGSRSESVEAIDGRFHLEDLAVGEYAVRIAAADHADGVISGVSVQGGVATDVGRIRLTRGGTVSGFVTSSEDVPIADARVVVTGANESGRSAITDATGAFEIHGVGLGRATAVATHPDYAPGQVAGLEVDPAGGATETRIVLSAGGRIEGWAREQDGTATAGVTIEVSPGEGQLDGFGRKVVATASDGTFVVEHLPPGQATVALMSQTARRSFSRERRVLIREQETARVEFLNRRILVSGRVTRLGAPAPEQRVQIGDGAAFSRPGLEPRGPAEPQLGIAVTREDGSYELFVGEAGRTGVSVTDREGSALTRSVEIPDADSFVFDISLEGVPIEGVVTDAASGRALPGTQVSVTSTSGAHAYGTTAGDGHFRLEGEPGEASVSAIAPGFAQATLATTVGPAGLADLRIPLERGQTIRGRVIDAAERGIFGVDVMAGTTDSGVWTAQTAHDGSFALGPLRNSPYVLLAASPTGSYGVLTNVAPGENDAVMTLRAPGQVRLRVLNPDGGPAGGVSVQIYSIDGAPIGSLSGPSEPGDDSGIWEFPLPVGSLELDVTAPGGQSRVSLLVPEGGSVETVVKLEADAQPAP